MRKFFREFKAFISRGNVMDMAVGIIIGGAFTSIVSSLVNDIITPLLGLFGGMNFDQYSWKISGDVTLNYGKFITAVINFLIMAFIIFVMMRAMNAMVKKFEKNKEEKKTWEVRSLLNPKIETDSLIMIKSKVLDGKFRVIKGKHTKDFETVITVEEA